MNRMIRVLALSFFAAAVSGLPAVAQDHPDQDQARSQNHQDNNTYRHHPNWQKGSRMQREDWNRGDKLDYQAHHLQAPPEGHEWRLIDGNYVLADRDGNIVSVRRAPRNHEPSHDEHPQ